MNPWSERPSLTGQDPADPRRSGSGDEYPQAIADDYPGWGVKHEGGHWTAWCPAITVHARTAAELRGAIEEAILPDDTAPGSGAAGY